MPVLPLFLAFQVSDPRLEMRASLTAPRVTYEELGGWITQKTGVPVTVAPAIRSRKATVLVQNRPVRETMNRVAEGLFLEWERTKAGYTMRLQPKVASEEAALLKSEREAQSTRLAEAVEMLVELGRSSPEALEQKMLEEGRGGSDRRQRLRTQLGSDHLLHAAGTVLAQLSPERRAAVLGGARIFATDKGGTGIGTVSKVVFESLAKQFEVPEMPDEGEGESSRPGPPVSIVMSLKGDPALGKLNVTATMFDKTGNAAMSTLTSLDNNFLGEDGDGGLLAKRLTAWATQDADVLSTKLKKGTTPLPEHSSSYHSMADVLVSLYRRSGLPIVADGFREAVAGEQDLNGTNVKAWVASLQNDCVVSAPNYLVRAEQGWLMLRRDRYWRQLAVEIPERSILRLERSAPTITDCAEFIKDLTPVQSEALGPESLVMDVPNASVQGNLDLLRLWGGLTATQRKRTVEGEPSLRTLSVPIQRLALACLTNMMDGESDPSDAFLPYLLPGAPLPPDDIALSLESREDINLMEISPFLRRSTNVPPQVAERHFSGFSATLSNHERVFRVYEIPLGKPKSR